MASKPTILHLGDPIKYNHDFYNDEFLPRFNVIQATETDRESFIEALNSQKYPQNPSNAKRTPANPFQIRLLLSPLPPTLPNRRLHGPMGRRTHLAPPTKCPDLRVSRRRLQLGGC